MTKQAIHITQSNGLNTNNVFPIVASTEDCDSNMIELAGHRDELLKDSEY